MRPILSGPGFVLYGCSINQHHVRVGAIPPVEREERRAAVPMESAIRRGEGYVDKHDAEYRRRRR